MTGKNTQAILAAVPHGAVRVHIADTLKHLAVVRFEPGVRELNLLGDTCRPVAALLYVDGSYDQVGIPHWVAQVRQLRAAWRSLPLIGYAPLTAKAFEQGVYATNAGVNEIALQGSHMLRDAVGRIVAATASDNMVGDIMRYVTAATTPLSDTTQRIIWHCIAHAHEGLTVGTLAAAIGLSRRTLTYRLKLASLPAPEQLIMWCRLLVAAWLLRDPSCAVNDAARALGWRELSALRSLAMKYLGCQPRTLRDASAIPIVAARMAASGRRTLNGQPQ
jgi:AraC-like DNA-binding protein